VSTTLHYKRCCPPYTTASEHLTQLRFSIQAFLLIRPGLQVYPSDWKQVSTMAETPNKGKGEVRFRLAALEVSLQPIEVVRLTKLYSVW
jgi:hypothetical protein